MPLRYIEKACSLVDPGSVQNASYSYNPGQHFYSPSFIDKHIERIHYDLIFRALPFPCPPDTSPRESCSSIIELCCTRGQHLLAELLIMGIAPQGASPWGNSSFI